MDCRKIPLDCGFDLLIDKGTMDTLLCGKNSYLNVARMLRECYRILVDNGYYLLVSTGSPDSRFLHLKRSHINFEIEVHSILREADGKQVTNYVYVCKKLKMEMENNWEREMKKIKK